MKRREMLLASGGAVLAAATGQAFAAEPAHEHGHQHIKTANKNVDLVKSANDCVLTAEPCLASCLEVLGAGDKTMRECAESIIELSAVCAALMKTAATGTKHLKQMAMVAKQVCLSCEEQCLKHKEYQQCLDCANACKKCAEVCDKYIGA
ncbi:MAG: four-helix bundle copper-binding protein [Nitrospinae bacterium]|nr:four-helix bundle copper-binding protein [Nitrospinota bacterium]